MLTQHRAYVIISGRSTKLGLQVEEILTSYGFTAYLPFRDTDQQKPASGIFAANFAGILHAELVIAVFGTHYGKDTTAEIGIARGLGKLIIGVDWPDMADTMSVQALNAIVAFDNLESAIRNLPWIQKVAPAAK
jgi:nucleoside 2-deoxyribosyltransferase